MQWLDGITDTMDMGLGWTPGVGDGQGGLVCFSSNAMFIIYKTWGNSKNSDRLYFGGLQNHCRW